VITTINAWNRIAISLGAYPGHGASGQGRSEDEGGVKS
jgi:hypothetical protein